MDLLELVVREVEGPYPVEVIRGVERVARDHDLAVVLSVARGRAAPGRGWVKAALSRRPSAVVAVSTDLTAAQQDQLAASGIPVVFVDPNGEPRDGAPTVAATNFDGGLAATGHLLELGHRRIAAITGPASARSSRDRLDGHRAALEAAGLRPDPALVREGAFRVSDGLAHGRDLLRLADRPTAVFALSDGMALGVYQAAAEAGLRIPGELSVVGFDDLPPAGWIVPPLTTVRQPLGEMAAAATAMAVRLARGEPLPHRRVELATGLVVRGSTAPPAPRVREAVMCVYAP